MPLLNGTLTLPPHIPDTEDLATRILRKWADKTHRRQLNPDEHEDALAYIITAAWNSYRKYTQRGKPFTRQLASTILWTACTDWERHTKGRSTWKFSATANINPAYVGQTHRRQKPPPNISFDDPTRREHQLVDTLTTSEMDAPEHSLTELRGVLAEAARLTSWETATLDNTTHDRTKKRTRRTQRQHQ